MRLTAAALGGVLVLGSATLASAAERSPEEWTPAVPWSQYQGAPAHPGASDTDQLAPPLEESWRFTPEEKGGLSAPVIAGDTVFALGRTNVYAVSTSSGELEWSIDREDGPITSPVVFESSSPESAPLLAYVEGEGKDTQLVAVDAAEGKEAWTLPLEEDSLSGLTAVGDQILVATRSGAVASVSASTGEETWNTVALKGPIDSAPAVDDSAAYFPVRDSADGSLNIVSIDLASGEKRWQQKAGLPGSTSSTLSVVHPGAADSDGSVFAVIPGFASGELYAFATSDGTVQYKTGIRAPVFPFSGMATSDGRLYISDLTGGIYGLSIADGSRYWDFQLNSTTQQRSAPIVLPGVVLSGFNDGRIAAVATSGSSEGHLIWQTDTGDGAVKLMAVSPELLVAAQGGDTGGLVAFRHSTGDEALVDVVSPTEMDPMGVVLAYVGAIALVAGAALLIGRSLGDRMAAAGSGDRDEESDEDYGPDEGEEV